MMNNPYTQRVYQKLSHTRQMLDLLNAGESLSQRQQNEALLQAGVLHLSLAFRCYLRELAAHYQHPRPDTVMGLKGVTSEDFMQPEVAELQRLHDEGQWLAELLLVVDEVENPGSNDNTRGVQQHNLIAVSRTVVPNLDEAWLRGVVSAFEDCVERQRGRLQEY